MREISGSTLLFLFLASAMVPAPAQVKAPIEFEVASLKQNTLDDRIVTIDVGPGGRFAARGYTLKLLIQRAFGMKGFQIAGGPSWLDVDRYDVEARAPAAVVAGDLTEDQLRPMLKALLIDRFRLRFHTVSKEMPGFALTVNGRSKLKPSAMTEEQSERTIRRRGAALVGKGVTAGTLATIFGSYLSRPVADETGLKGLYDFEIAWTERADQVAPEDQGGVSLISALRDQLGLRLTPRSVGVDTIVIDSAEKASPN
jgi:uncharacterized protein (TIGR03435 family)